MEKKFNEIFFCLEGFDVGREHQSGGCSDPPCHAAEGHPDTNNGREQSGSAVPKLPSASRRSRRTCRCRAALQSGAAERRCRAALQSGTTRISIAAREEENTPTVGLLAAGEEDRPLDLLRGVTGSSLEDGP
ncbi:hypothetical protein EYF80_065502 [Liparis tanakae]|uniref:Uncharacterized protein n=1 Tax=Liparis tanakae TaxID=230148 RepID=A0A4Z2E6H4_9TELE|nr:hypothetical protein EYF80_065502 [Liparis tanakae]